VLVGLDEARQKVIIDSIIGQRLSVRDAERLAKGYKEGKSSHKGSKEAESLLRKYQEELSASLPFKHTIKAKSVEIRFTDEKEIEKFLAFFKKA
jgi:ParB family chromosome partitioning protein